MATPYMGLTLPTVGTTAGPTYATLIDTAIETIDAHDHTSGKGPLVPTAGIGINAALPFNGYNATGLNAALFVNQTGVLSAATIRAVYVAGGDLYYNNASGTAVQITTGGSVNTGGSGNISGMDATSAVTYATGTKTYTFTQSATFPAKVAHGDIILYETVTGATQSITIKAPASLSTTYSFTLPNAVPATSALPIFSTAFTMSFLAAPASTSLLQSTSGGAISYVTTLPTGLTVPSPTLTGTVVISSTTITGNSTLTGTITIKSLDTTTGGDTASGILVVERGTLRPAIQIKSYSTSIIERGFLLFQKSNTNTIGGAAETTDGTFLGVVAVDGVNTLSSFVPGGSIRFIQRGAAGNFLPTDLIFGVATSAATTTQRAWVSSEGNFGIGTATVNDGNGAVGALLLADATAPTSALDAGISGIVAVSGGVRIYTQSGPGTNGLIATFANNGAVTLAGTLTVTGAATLSSTASVSGTLTTADVALTGSLTLNGLFVQTNSQQSANTGSGAIVTAGGVGIGKAVFIGGSISVAGISVLIGDVTVTSVTDAVNTTTGALHSDGGISAVKALWIGGLANIAGTVTMQGAATVGTTLGVTGAATFSSTLLVTGVLTLSNVPRFNGTNTTGLRSPAFGSNGPYASVGNIPFTWFQVTTADGSTGYIPVWK